MAVYIGDCQLLLTWDENCKCKLGKISVQFGRDSSMIFAAILLQFSQYIVANLGSGRYLWIRGGGGVSVERGGR